MQSYLIDRKVQMPCLYKGMHTMSFIVSGETFQIGLSTLKHGSSRACQRGMGRSTKSCEREVESIRCKTLTHLPSPAFFCPTGK